MARFLFIYDPGSVLIHQLCRAGCVAPYWDFISDCFKHKCCFAALKIAIDFGKIIKEKHS